MPTKPHLTPISSVISPGPSSLGTALTPADELAAVLQGLPAPLAALTPDRFEKMPQCTHAYQAGITLLGKTAAAYLYWPNPGKPQAPVIAVVGPDKLTADALFGVGAALDVGLSQPVLFWMKQGGQLARAVMPRNLQRRMETLGMPGVVATEPGFNLFGRIASGFVADVLKPAPVQLDPNNLFVGVAKSAQGYAISLSLGVGTSWQNPFDLADTTIRGATVRLVRDNTDQTVEAWGTATLRAQKDVTLYVKRVGVDELSLGFDLSDATLEDFFLVLGVASKSLHLPDLPAPSGLPLKLVTLENPVYQSRPDASAPPDFATMMFKGTRKVAGVGELIANARGKVFQQPVAAIALQASDSGVKGVADVSVSLGLLAATSARFYLDVSLGDAPRMGLTASTVFGKLDLKAGGAGLQLSVPPQCPLQPWGLSATLTDLSLAEPPIAFQWKNCATGVIEDGVNLVVEGGQIVRKVGQQAAGAADTVIGAATQTAGEVGKDVGGAVGDAGKAVGDAGKAAGGAVGGIGKTIGKKFHL
ncbi:MAG: hypothetical protein HZA31_05580 [Opitutae bacterium]|nr:hypothetical protein [Opitutae bacterium]